MAVEQGLQYIEAPHSVSKSRRLGRGIIDVFAPTLISAPLRERRGAYPNKDLGRWFGWLHSITFQVVPAIAGVAFIAGGNAHEGAIFAAGGYTAGKITELGNHIFERKVRENR